MLLGTIIVLCGIVYFMVGALLYHWLLDSTCWETDPELYIALAFWPAMFVVAIPLLPIIGCGKMILKIAGIIKEF